MAEASPDRAYSNPDSGSADDQFAHQANVDLHEEEEEEEEVEEEEEEEPLNIENNEDAQKPSLDMAVKEPTSSKAASGSGKIFIGGLAGETTTEKLTKHFRKYGEIIDSVIMRNRVTGHTRGFGFVTYADPSVCERVLQDKHVLDGKTVEIKRSIPREKMVKGPRTKKVFVGGIPTSVKEDEFQDCFSKFGKITERQIMHDRTTGRSRGFGFVTFESEDSVDELLADGGKIELGGKPVEIKKAEPKRSVPEPGPPPGRVGTRGGDYGGFDDFGGPYGGGYSGPYRPGSGDYGPRSGPGFGGRGGYGGYPRGGYGDSAYGGAPFGGGYAGGYDGYGGGYGGVLGGYGDYDYGGIPYGGSSSYGGGYGASGGGYGGGRHGGSGGGGVGGRYHPYTRN
ncbi:hypothetical protein GOP47_0002177 [Adiantum capillus-veneris]|uniref:RRM domain-containing protein n=1 Tax=Adiantum capillus-veneris TaxID=13818 RepID=A0A9D4ZN15_ADICA|nr:hypothetical protein GOP47_0001411 [Adiantum capillus-veneris]KAI5082434.1 hypothetical protein GOP47_0002177 [Adiantum capillus-veneris]